MERRASAGKEAVVRVRDLSFRFQDRRVLERIDFTVFRGETLVIMGESGCGKTTLLKTLIGLLKPEQGTVEVLGQDITGMDEDALDDFRGRIGMLFQFGALINSLTVGENVLLALERRLKVDRSLAEKVARFKLSMVGLHDAFDRYPSEMSGGMKKRAGLARALVLDPKILFFDEPTSGLDPITAAGLNRLILELKKLMDVTMVVVTHDLSSAFEIGDRILMMHQGRIAACGNEAELKASEDPAVRRFIERRGPERHAEPDHRLAALFREDY